MGRVERVEQRQLDLVASGMEGHILGARCHHLGVVARLVSRHHRGRHRRRQRPVDRRPEVREDDRLAVRDQTGVVGRRLHQVHVAHGDVRTRTELGAERAVLAGPDADGGFATDGHGSPPGSVLEHPHGADVGPPAGGGECDRAELGFRRPDRAGHHDQVADGCGPGRRLCCGLGRRRLHERREVRRDGVAVDLLSCTVGVERSREITLAGQRLADPHDPRIGRAVSVPSELVGDAVDHVPPERRGCGVHRPVQSADEIGPGPARLVIGHQPERGDVDIIENLAGGDAAQIRHAVPIPGRIEVLREVHATGLDAEVVQLHRQRLVPARQVGHALRVRLLRDIGVAAGHHVHDAGLDDVGEAHVVGTDRDEHGVRRTRSEQVLHLIDL